jgi:hypothetical protein
MTIRFFPAAAVIAGALGSPVAAQVARPSAPSDAHLAACEVVAQAAEAMMESRQRGASLSSALATAGDDGRAREIAINAWERPRYATPEYQRMQVENFRDAWHVACLRSPE